MKVSVRFLVIALSLFVFRCATTTTSTGSEADRVALAALLEAWQDAANRGDWGGVAALYADDAVLMPPNMATARGRGSIREAFAGLGQMSPRDIRLQVQEIEICGDTAYEVGTYSMSIQPAGASRIEDRGKYIVIHKRQSDGRWLIARDIFNSDMPMQ